MTMRVGAVLPMLATATGLVFAAFFPRHFTDPLIKASLNAEESYNVFARDAGSIERLIIEVREQGYAYNEGHLMPGVSALAFPLIDRGASLVAVMAAMGRHERLKPPDSAEMIAYLKDAASSFSR